MEGISTHDNIGVTISEVLLQVGEYGRFQRLLDAVICIINIPIAMQFLIMTFLAISPTWKCIDNSTMCLFNGTLNADDGRRCILPRESWEYTEAEDFSLVTQFDIHCEHEWLLSLLSSIFFIGWGVGAIILGWVGDNYGRKILIFPSFTIIIVIGCISSYLPNIHLILAGRFVIGFFVQGTVTQGLILISEVVGDKHRPLACLVVFLTFSLGWCLLAIQASLVKNWKVLSIMCTVPYIFVLLFYKFVPESIRWLTLRGKKEEVMRILSTIGRWNQKNIPDNITIISEEAITQNSNLFDLFRTRKITVQSLSLGYIWIATTMIYYGTYMAAEDLGGSLYRDFALLSLVDIPGIFLSVYICNRFGRKTCTIIPLLLGGMISIAVGFTPLENNYKYVRVALGVVGLQFLSFAFNIRSIGMGFAMVAARIGSGTAPWVVKSLKPFGGWCPFVALAIPSLIGFFIGLLLPETKVGVSPDTDEGGDRTNSNANLSYAEHL